MIQNLSIRLLGKPAVSLDGQVVKFPTQKALALLIYLVVEGEAQSRQMLMTLLWPDSSPQAAQASLRNALARLRTALQQAAPAIVATQDTIGFDLDIDYTLDLHTVTTAVAAIHQDKTTPIAPAVLQAAVDAYQDEFLAAFTLPQASEFNHWITVQREKWHRDLSLILEYLTEYHLEHHALAEAIATATRWVIHDSLNEAAYRGLMQAHFLAGDRSAALQAFQSCQTALADELAVPPAPETTKLAETIRRDAPGNRRQRRESAPAQFSLPLIGRADEFARLVTAYRAVEAGALQAVVVSGESGVGKTRLVTEFLDWASIQGGDILHGRAFEAGGQLPYQPIVSALRERLGRENAPKDLLAGVWLAELSRLLPELLERYPDLGEALISYGSDVTTARARLFEAVARLGTVLSERQPLVLILDDWQWADTASLDLLPYLSQSWATSQASILLVLTMRSEDLETHTALKEWLAAWERQIPVTHERLARLTPAATVDFVEAWAGAGCNLDCARALSEVLFEETGGNPFFLVETVQFLTEQTNSEPGRIDLTAVLAQIEGGLALPPTVRKALLSRLAEVDQSAMALLAAAAVLGRDCSFEELCQVSGIDELDGLPALDALLARQLISETNDSRTPYTFAHDKIRDVVYTEAGHSRRRIFHRRALDALAQTAPAAELAYHAEQARLPDRAIRYLLLAGDAAAASYANTEAIAYYDKALELGGRSQLSTEEVIRLCLNHGRVLEHAGAYNEALDCYTALGALAEERQDDQMKLSALVASGTLRSNPTPVHDPIEAETLAEAGLALAQQVGDQAAEARINWNLMQMAIFRAGEGDGQRAVAYGEASLALSRKLDLREQMALTLSDLYQAYRGVNQIDQANAAISEAQTLLEKSRNLPMLAGSYLSRAILLLWSGQFDEALLSANKAIDISASIGNLHNQGLGAYVVGAIYLERGEIGQTIGLLEATKRIEGMNQIKLFAFFFNYCLADAYLEVGTDALADKHARAACVAAAGLPLFMQQAAQAMLARMLLSDGNIRAARQELAAIGQDLNKGTISTFWAVASILLTEAAVALAEGNGDQAETFAAEVVGLTEKFKMYMFLPEALYLKAKALLMQGLIAEASAELAQAQAKAVELGNRRMLWKILAARADLTGDEAAAARLREQAQAEVAFRADHAGSPEL